MYDLQFHVSDEVAFHKNVEHGFIARFRFYFSANRIYYRPVCNLKI